MARNRYGGIQMKKKLLIVLCILLALVLIATAIGPHIILAAVRQPKPADSYAYSDSFYNSYDDVRAHLQALDAKKPVIACADFNVAHQEIDLKNPGPNRGNAGFSDEERAQFSNLLAAGFTDSFRFRNPDAVGCYSWWSYRFNARKNNAGWRIDYFLVSDRLRDRISETPIYNEIYGSDHCPVGLTIEV